MIYVYLNVVRWWDDLLATRRQVKRTSNEIKDTFSLKDKK